MKGMNSFDCRYSEEIDFIFSCFLKKKSLKTPSKQSWISFFKQTANIFLWTFFDCKGSTSINLSLKRELGCRCWQQHRKLEWKLLLMLRRRGSRLSRWQLRHLQRQKCCLGRLDWKQMSCWKKHKRKRSRVLILLFQANHKNLIFRSPVKLDDLREASVKSPLVWVSAIPSSCITCRRYCRIVKVWSHCLVYICTCLGFKIDIYTELCQEEGSFSTWWIFQANLRIYLLHYFVHWYLLVILTFSVFCYHIPNMSALTTS